MTDEQDDAMNSGLGVAERELLLAGLHALPDAPPPREVWQRIAAQAEAEGLLAAPRRRLSRHWLAGAGLAAAVLLVVLRIPSPGLQDPGADTFPTEPAYVEATNGGGLDALMVQSRLLEQDLRALPAKPHVMRAGTAATISDLESRIAAIDHALSDPAGQLSASEVEIYWRERVRLMDSLVQVRYAQAQRSSF